MTYAELEKALEERALFGNSLIRQKVIPPFNDGAYGVVCLRYFRPEQADRAFDRLHAFYPTRPSLWDIELYIRPGQSLEGIVTVVDVVAVETALIDKV